MDADVMTAPSQEALDLAQAVCWTSMRESDQTYRLIDAALAKAKADAWDEGHKQGAAKLSMMSELAAERSADGSRVDENPYRAAEVRGGGDR